MEKTELRNKLKENFNLETWKNILGKMFHKIDYLSDPLAELSQCILDSSNGSIINVI